MSSSSEMGDGESVGSELKFRTYALLVALGVAVILVVGFWRLYRFTVSARPQDMLPVSVSVAGGGGGGGDVGKVAAALRQRDIAALPVFVHGDGSAAAAMAVAVAGEEGSAAGAVECAVCLAEMKDGERGRLLPECGHRFHVDCIDQWFRANSTCPLCRAAAFGEASAAEVNKDAEVAAPVVVVHA